MKKNILVVDDEADVVEFLTTLLEDNGYQTRSATNGIEAMDRVRDRTPDLILLDLQMPEETGTGFYRKIRDRRELKDIPIIIVSGLAGRNVAVSPSVCVLDKPLDPSRILEEVRKAVGEAD
jgi:CheY-like chemotaxis protein